MKKHVICFGDSNTHGYCADPADCADGGDRFNEEERWPCLLQKALGEDCLVLEEGLSGRTTVFPDPLHECMAGLDVIYSTLMSHEPVARTTPRSVSVPTPPALASAWSVW